MGRIFNRDKKDGADEELARNMALTHEARPEITDQDYLHSLGQSVFMIMDADVSKLLSDEEKPAFSHLNRVTKIGQKEAELQMLDYEAFFLVDKLNMNEDEFESKGWKRSISKRIFARSIINDAQDGFKAKIVTEQRKFIRTEVEKKKKGWF